MYAAPPQKGRIHLGEPLNEESRLQAIDVIIVGAGPAGIGMAMELKKIGGLEFAILERHRVGESFRRWPIQTKFITPSFYSSPFGLADLNAVDPVTSPAAFAGTQHLTGQQYADYLLDSLTRAQIPTACDCKVLGVQPHPDGGFYLNTEQGELFTRFLIWACGEFQFPDLNPFPGADQCLHYAQIADWSAMEKGDYVVVGGYESGLDSAFNLIQQGHRVRLLVRRRTWDRFDELDPSLVLSPYTRDRLREIESNERLEIIYDVNVVEVAKNDCQGFRVHAGDGRSWEVGHSPILGTGFLKGGGARQIKDLWGWDEDGHVLLSDVDESINTPGLFLVGPQVRHDKRIYCFNYKFRQRFAIISKQIATRLQLSTNWTDGSQDGIWGPFGNSECCEGCEC
ncbi:MAG: NAD(P)/FAD-dependent oxidoreductase [Pseudomonadota bacterium]